jgi:hypothetical protein
VSGPGGSTGGSALSTSALRGAINSPAFELKGCTATQDDVARLMSRLRLINGVQRVTLQDSVKASGAQGASTAGTAPVSSSTAGSGSCPVNGPGFDMVVFFQPLPAAFAAGGTAPAPGPAPATGPAPAAGTAPASGAPGSPATQASSTASQASTTSISAGTSSPPGATK